MMKNDDKIFVEEQITDDLNSLCHFGVPGQKRGQHDESRRWQNHAVYARGNPRYARKQGHDNLSDETLFSNAASEFGEGEVNPSYRKYLKDPEFRQKWNKAADVGLEALVRAKYVEPEEVGDDVSRSWFLYEDQTIGLPQIAYLMTNKGYSAKDIKRLMKYSDTKLHSGEDFDNENSEILAWMLKEGSWYEGYHNFANNIEQVLKEQGRK